MKFLKRNLLLILLALLFFVSCSETDDVESIGNWVDENTAKVSEIAAEARVNATGDWKVFLSYGLDASKEWPDDYYVYCRVKRAGTGTTSPAYNDVVSVICRGRLIDGYAFYSPGLGEFDPDSGMPVDMNLDECVSGFVTALQEMVSGDVWEVYIPARLGYGEMSLSGIPAHSMLIYDIHLVDFRHNGEEE